MNIQKQLQINIRTEYLKTLQEFIFSSKQSLHTTLQSLNWSEETTIFSESEKALKSCPLNPDHRVSSGNLDKHTEECRWHQQGYTDDCLPLPSSSTCSSTTVIMDKTLQAEVILKAAASNPSLKIGENVNQRDVPRTSDRVFSDFTTDERRILYDYVVSKTAGILPQLKEFSLPTLPLDKSGQMTQEQLMAAERDAKRRRIRYRTHTNHKNYSEVMREVINSQMLAYQEWLTENYGVIGPSPSTCDIIKDSEEKVSEKQEMIWLDWSFQYNPNLRWKYLLQKEKRRKEYNSDNHNHDRRKEREDSSSRKNRYESLKHRYKSPKRDRFKSDHRQKINERKEYDSERDRHRYDHKRSDKLKDKFSMKDESGNFMKKEHSSRDFREKDRHKRRRPSYEHDSRYKDNGKSYRRSTCSKCDKKHERGSLCVKIEKTYDDFTFETDCDGSNHRATKSQFVTDKCKLEENESSSDDKSNKSSLCSSESKNAKRRKSSKKKHKHKHNKKHKKRSS